MEKNLEMWIDEWKIKINIRWGHLGLMILESGWGYEVQFSNSGTSGHLWSWKFTHKNSATIQSFSHDWFH